MTSTRDINADLNADLNAGITDVRALDNETNQVYEPLTINGPGTDKMNIGYDEMSFNSDGGELLKISQNHSDLLTLNEAQVLCMKRVMSMDSIKKGDKISGLKYTSTWRELIGLIEQLFITASTEEKAYSEYFIGRIGVWLGEQCLDNPYIYVSHGPNHSFEVVEYLEMLYDNDNIVQKSIYAKYGLQYRKMYRYLPKISVYEDNIIFTRILLRLLALLHDVGYSDVASNPTGGETIDKWIHAMSGVRTIVPEIEQFLYICINIVHKHSTTENAKEKVYHRHDWFENTDDDTSSVAATRIWTKRHDLIRDFKKAIWYHNADTERCNLEKMPMDDKKNAWIEKYNDKCVFKPTKDKQSVFFNEGDALEDPDEGYLYREYIEASVKESPFIYLIRAADNLDFTRNRMVNFHKNKDLIKLTKDLFVLATTMGEMNRDNAQNTIAVDLQKYLVDNYVKRNPLNDSDTDIINIKKMFDELKTDKGFEQFPHWYSVFCVLKSIVTKTNKNVYSLDILLDGSLGDVGMAVENNLWMALHQVTRLKESLDSVKSDGNKLTDKINVRVKKIISPEGEMKEGELEEEIILDSFVLSDINKKIGKNPQKEKNISSDLGYYNKTFVNDLIRKVLASDEQSEEGTYVYLPGDKQKEAEEYLKSVKGGRKDKRYKKSKKSKKTKKIKKIKRKSKKTKNPKKLKRKSKKTKNPKKLKRKSKKKKSKK
jgi:hypothetical protein